MIGQHFIGLQDIFSGQGVEPCGNAEAVVVFESGASGGEQMVWSGRGQQGFDFVGACVDEEPVGLTVFLDTVVTALTGRKLPEKIGGDASALQKRTVGPGGVAIHAAEQNALTRVGAGTEVGVEDIGVRPEFQRKAEDLKYVAAHALARRSRGLSEWRKLVEGEYLLAGVGG